ncbi:hypothetical protein KBC85_02000 [Candidatus Saccharibacteria bacterium]|nr:hypothetical protein [Candidatus Saccharibacteria bacterium]MDQ5885255.1 hypothetical protein [Patescibacteria group bacterium]
MVKLYIYIGIFVGSIIGSYLPVLLFNVNMLSFISIIGGVIGSFIGLFAGYYTAQALES